MSADDNQMKLAPGMLLIASANLMDPNFGRSVILLCEHQPAGSFGLILNRRLPIRLSDVATQELGWDASLYRGGPVQENSLHFLHRRKELDIGSEEVLPGIFWGGDFERLSQMLRYGEAEVDDVRFFVGYSGWGEGQLQDEMERDSWYTRRARPDLVFPNETENLWRDTLGTMGRDFRMVANFPDDPRLN